MRIRIICLCAALALAGGCSNTPQKWHADARGWTTYSGSYSSKPEGVISIDGGCVAKTDVAWNGNRVSFSLYEDPAVSWAAYLFDKNFEVPRMERLKTIPASVDGKWYKRADLAPNVWATAIVIRMEPVRVKGVERTGVLVKSTVNLHPSAVTGEKKHYALKPELLQNRWNDVVLDFSNGFARCFINGVVSQEFRYDSRLNGAIGFHVTRGTSLLIKNFRVGPIPVDQRMRAKKGPDDLNP